MTQPSPLAAVVASELNHSAESERRRRAVTEWLFDLGEWVMSQGLDMVQGAAVAIITPTGYLVRVWEETTDEAISACQTAMRDAEFKQRFGVNLSQQRRENREREKREWQVYEAAHPFKCDECRYGRFKTERGLKMHKQKAHRKGRS